jgi:hypothetical protein
MKPYILLFLFILSVRLSYAQSCAVPLVVDFSASPEASTVITAARSGNCCGDSNCISFLIKSNPLSDMINFTADQITGSSFYTINCGPLIPIGTPACISGLTSVQINFCKPGANAINYTITAFRGTTTSGDLSLRQGCTGTMSANGYIQSSISWTSIYPGATGAYNSYLSSTSAVSSVTVAPPLGAPAYIDYQVSGIESTVCNMTKTNVVRVYTYAALTVALTPTTPLICSGSPVTLTANPTGGKSAYTYLWSNGATTASITVSTPATYTVSVNDQTANCGAVSAQAVVVAVTPVAPTASPVAAICVGNTATLNATAPGSPYKWYNASTNGTLLSSNSSYTTPILNSVATYTYYLQSTNSGCPSPLTAVAVTVNPNPVKPSISP